MKDSKLKMIKNHTKYQKAELILIKYFNAICNRLTFQNHPYEQNMNNLIHEGQMSRHNSILDSTIFYSAIQMHSKHHKGHKNSKILSRYTRRKATRKNHK